MEVPHQRPRSSAAVSSPELLDAVGRGEPRALERWYRAEHPQVWRTCLGLMADPTEADDLAQDAMLKLADRLDRRDPAVPYAAWRTKVVVNLCRDRRRRIAARRRAEEAGAAERPETALPDPSEVASQAELQQLVRDLLQRLPEREREAFVLRELEHLTTDEVAEAMEVGASTVRSLTTLARRRLRDLIEPRLAAGRAGEEGTKRV